MEEKIAELLEERFMEDDLKDCFLVDLKLHSNRKLEIFIDSDLGIDFEKCRMVSRYLESFLDKEQWLGENYTLDVSSPGVSRPLKIPRQYYKHMGRKLEIKLKEGGKETGILTNVNEGGIVIQKKERIKEGKKKQTVITDLNFPFEQIKESLVKISFK